ncbi:MAG: FHA domain-containing protein [Caldisericia bacterium]|nr:FHA domain-containing protein [Caldisericia bacterium]
MEYRKNKINEIKSIVIDSTVAEDLVIRSCKSTYIDDFLKHNHHFRKTVSIFAWLLCVEIDNLGERFDINQKVTSIGRDSANQISILDESISENHAKIKYFPEDDVYKIYDLFSTNGTKVNNKKVENPTVLDDNNSVKIGFVRFVFKKVDIKLAVK